MYGGMKILSPMKRDLVVWPSSYSFCVDRAQMSMEWTRSKQSPLIASFSA